jgi:N-acetylglucosamine kinase-like BadF-type ATPase
VKSPINARQSDSPTVRPSVVVGVDAGASHTAVAIADSELRVLARAVGPGSAMRPGGGSRSAAVIVGLVREAAERAGLSLPSSRLVVGAAGAGRDLERVELETALAAAGVAREVRVLGDAEVALSAAFGEGPGILVNAGTGSIAYARDLEGVVHRSGGYGWQMSDEGSGYWLGRRALEAAGRAVDGRGEESTLLTRLLTALSLQDFDGLVRWAATATPAQVAALAQPLLNAAGEGELVAQRAVGDAAREIVALARSLERYFPGTAPLRVALTGGLLSSGSPLRAATQQILGDEMPRARLSSEPVDHPLGALRLALGATG